MESITADTLLNATDLTGNNGEPLVEKVFDTPDGLKIVTDYRWYDSVPEADADLILPEENDNLPFPMIGDPSKDMVTALAALFIQALRAPDAREELMRKGCIIVNHPNWGTDDTYHAAWRVVTGQFRRKGWDIRHDPMHYYLYHRR